MYRLMQWSSSQGNRADFTLTPSSGTPGGVKQVNNSGAKLNALVKSTKADAKLRENNAIHSKNTFTVSKAGDFILNLICHS